MISGDCLGTQADMGNSITLSITEPVHAGRGGGMSGWNFPPAARMYTLIQLQNLFIHF